jgi:hypothetical protein
MRWTMMGRSIESIMIRRNGNGHGADYRMLEMKAQEGAEVGDIETVKYSKQECITRLN